MKTKTSIIAVSVLTGIIIIGSMAMAQNPPQNNMGNQNRNQMQQRQNMMNMMCPVRLFPALPQRTIEAVSPMLNLTAAQQANADQLFTALTKKIAEIRGKTAYTQNLADEMKSTKTDPEKVNALADAAMKQEAEILKAELQTWMEFEKTLNTEQQTALWNMMFNRQGGMNRGFGMRGQGQGQRQNQQQGMWGQRNNQQNNNQSDGQGNPPEENNQ